MLVGNTSKEEVQGGWLEGFEEKVEVFRSATHTGNSTQTLQPQKITNKRALPAREH